MALFRALMAEEEAATALFLCLKRRRYRGAKLLRQRDHVHKNAVIPFFYAMGNVIAQLGDNAPDVGVVTTSDRAALELRIKFKHPKTMEDSWAYPVPPLNFSMSGGPSGQKLKLEDFAAGLDQLISETKAKDIVDYVRDRANQRNQLLYAGAEGYPAVAGDIERGLRVYQQHVFALIQAYLLIDPHSGNQLFVQQVLDAFLKALRLLPKDIEGDVA